MDLLREIKSKLVRFADYPSIQGIKAAIRHIEVAERYLGQARCSNPDAYNDVIYRTNQAFEGMLKEAYRAIEPDDHKKLTTYEIEQHLLKEKKLSERTIMLIQKYRQDWRNPSAHDHTLFFSDQEALLAIVNVSAFSVVLLDQMLESIAYHLELSATRHLREPLEQELSSEKKRPFAEYISLVLQAFSLDIGSLDLLNASETQVIGSLCGFLEGFDPSIKKRREVLLGDGPYRADLIIEKDKEAILIEVKGCAFQGAPPESALPQVLTYLNASGLRDGIAYVVPSKATDEMVTRQVKSGSGAKGKRLWLVAPVARLGTIPNMLPKTKAKMRLASIVQP